MSKRTVRQAFIATIFISGLVLGTSSASAQAPARRLGDSPYRLALIDAPVSVEAPFGDFARTRPGETWKMPLTAAFYCDGLALNGVALTRSVKDEPDSVALTFDVAVALRAWPEADGRSIDLDFIVIDGRRQLRLGTITDIVVRPGKTTSSSRTLLLSARDFESFFGDARTPTLRVTRSTRDL